MEIELVEWPQVAAYAVWFIKKVQELDKINYRNITYDNP